VHDHEPHAVETDAAAASADDRAPTPLWLAITIAVVFATLYAYDVWEAINNFVGLGLQADALGIGLSAFGLVLLIVGLIVPFAVFGLAFWLARSRTPLVQLLIFFTGYCLVQVLSAQIDTLFGMGGLAIPVS
jgi:hypothetical protein